MSLLPEACHLDGMGRGSVAVYVQKAYAPDGDMDECSRCRSRADLLMTMVIGWWVGCDAGNVPSSLDACGIGPGIV